MVFLNLRLFGFYFDHDAFTRHASHVLDAPGYIKAYCHYIDDSGIICDLSDQNQAYITFLTFWVLYIPRKEWVRSLL